MAAERAGRQPFGKKVVNEEAVHNFNCVIELETCVFACCAIKTDFRRASSLLEILRYEADTL
jgi:hypothetical protein